MSTPPPSTPAATPAKPYKMDVRMFLQSPSYPAPSSDPPSSSPSIRPSPLPQQQQPQNPSQPPSQPSQLGAHSYTPFSPQNAMRPPPQQNSGAGGSGGRRSPGFPRQQMTNGNGPRPPNAAPGHADVAPEPSHPDTQRPRYAHPRARRPRPTPRPPAIIPAPLVIEQHRRQRRLHPPAHALLRAPQHKCERVRARQHVAAEEQDCAQERGRDGDQTREPEAADAADRASGGKEARKKRIAEEVQKKKEKAKAKAEAEEKERKAKAEAEEKERLRKEEEEKEKVRLEEPKEDDQDTLATPVKPKEAPLRIDTAPAEARRRPAPADLSTTFKPKNPATHPSALATARKIDDLSRVSYPENIRPPKDELNVNARDGMFIYDRDFLLQFMSICTEKPDRLPPLDDIGIGPVDQNSIPRTNSRGGPHRAARMLSISHPSGGYDSVGFPGFGGSKAAVLDAMGNFVPGSESTQERFDMTSSNLSTSISGIGSPFNRMPPMTRLTSQGGVGSQLGSNRGEACDKDPQLAQGTNSRQNQSIFEELPPLQANTTRWDRKTVGAVDADSPELIGRKVKALLNKLTMESFDSISDKIIDWANKSEQEKDGRTLIQVVRRVFEHATDDARWSEMYARLSRKMMEQISPKVQDDGVKNADGKPIVGSQLFRKYLLNRCQEDFERGWVLRDATATTAASKSSEDVTEAAAAESDEIVLHSESDEYYAAQKAKQQALALIEFIGELYKLGMLTERIMHECVKKLLSIEHPEDEEIEILCKLLSAVGFLLDTAKARAHIDVYFSCMKELGKSNNVSSRMQFILLFVFQDVIELRERKWIARTQVAAPTTIAGVCSLIAAKDRANQEKEQYQRTMGMSRAPAQRRRLIFAPRTKPAEEVTATPEATPAGSDNSESKDDAAPEMSKDDADKKIAEDSKKFFAVRNLDEAEVYFSALPTVHHPRLVEKLVGTAVEGKEALAQLVADFLGRVVSKEFCSVDALEEGFGPLVEILEDIAIDAPKAPINMALMLKAASFDSERTARIAAKSMEPDSLLALLS
ncbi:hypothetical protein DFH08DRAFT_695670, partial [Mycena albidolilacea]